MEICLKISLLYLVLTYSAQRMRFFSSNDQTINGSFNVSGNRFNNFYIYNNKNVILNGPINVRTFLALYDGSILFSTPINIISLDRAEANAIIAIHSSSFINGPLRRILPNAVGGYQFPVGKSSDKKVTDIISPNGASNSYWTVEYMDNSPDDDGYDITLAEADLNLVSDTEYWKIEGPAGYTARLQFSLSGTSDVANGIGNLSDLRIIRWSGTQWEIVGGPVTITGNSGDGTVTCNENITFSGSTQFFTLGSVEPATAEFTSGTNSICPGTSTPLEVTFDGVAPFSFTYTANGADPATISGINTNPYTFNVSPLVNTTYEITAMTHAYGNGIVIGSPITITVIDRPQVTIGTDTPICQGGDVNLTVTLVAGTAPFTFTWSLNGFSQGTISDVSSPHTFSHGPLTWEASGGPFPDPKSYVFRIEYVADGQDVKTIMPPTPNPKKPSWFSAGLSPDQRFMFQTQNKNWFLFNVV
jgi:hypothetical protein